MNIKESLMPIGSPSHKLARWFVDRFTPSTFLLDISGFILATTISCLSWKKQDFTPALYIGITYIAVQAVRAFLIIKRKEVKNLARKRTIHTLFRTMNRNMFGDSANHHRFTLFVPDLIHKEYITPYVRFSVGGNGISDSDKSKSYYPRGVGYTGMAWESPDTYHSRKFPEFSTRDAFELYYTETLNIPEKIVTQLSSTMQKVKQIFCYGFIDSNDQFIGVLSLDSCISWDPNENQYLGKTLIIAKEIISSLFSEYRRV
jgi:hypothetical protein